MQAPSIIKRRKAHAAKEKGQYKSHTKYKKPYSKKTTAKKTSDEITCCKRGKVGHKDNNYKVKKKVSEICAEYPNI